MKMTVLLIIIGALGTVTKGWVKGLEDLEIRKRVDSIQTTALLRSSRIRKECWGLEEICCHLDSSEKTSTDNQMSKIILLIIYALIKNINYKIWLF